MVRHKRHRLVRSGVTLLWLGIWLGLLVGCTAQSAPTPTPDTAQVSALISQADRAYTAQDWARAAELYGRLVQVQPNVAEWWIRYGWALRYTRQYEAALDAFARADALAPNAYWSAYGEGLTYLALKRYDEALNALNRAIAIDPTRPGPHQWRGRIYLKLKHYDAAIDVALYGLNYIPDDETLHNILNEAKRQLRW